jgi:hypothetical protein
MLREVEVKVGEFSNIDHVHKIKTYFFPLFEDFGTKINDFYERMDRMEDCISIFDRDMNIKVNKS